MRWWWQRSLSESKHAPLRMHLPHAFQAGSWTPDWKAGQNWMADQGYSASAAWAFTGSWLDHLQSELGSPYISVASENFRLLCPFTAKKSQRTREFLESALQRLIRILGPAALAGPGPLVVLIFYDSEEYLTYHANFGRAGEEGASQGCFIPGGYPHIATYGGPTWSLEITLAHELTHNLLERLPLPLWLNEGLALLAPDPLGLGGSQMKEIVKDKAEIRECWQRHGLAQFWSGQAFSMPDDRQKRAYQLAEVMARLLLSSPSAKQGFASFVAEADRHDAGDAAARKHMGIGLTECAAQFLGPGPWTIGTHHTK